MFGFLAALLAILITSILGTFARFMPSPSAHMRPSSGGMWRLAQMPITLLITIIGAIVAAMFAVGDVDYDSDGDAVDVQLTATLTANKLAYVQGWYGISKGSGDSGDYVALDVAQNVYQIVIPGTLDVSAGDTLYIDTAQVTGHIPDGAGYGTSSGGTNLPIGKVIGSYWAYSGERVVLVRLASQ